MPKVRKRNRLSVNRDPAMMLRQRLWYSLMRSIAEASGVDIDFEVKRRLLKLGVAPSVAARPFSALVHGDRIVSRGTHGKRKFDLFSVTAAVTGFESTLRFIDHPLWLFLARPPNTRQGIEKYLQCVLAIQPVSDALEARLALSRLPNRSEKLDLLKRLRMMHAVVESYQLLDEILVCAITHRFLGLWGARTNFSELGSLGVVATINTWAWAWANRESLRELERLAYERIFKHEDISLVADAIEGERPTRNLVGVTSKCLPQSILLITELISLAAHFGVLDPVARERIIADSQKTVANIPFGRSGDVLV